MTIWFAMAQDLDQMRAPCQPEKRTESERRAAPDSIQIAGAINPTRISLAR
jgi:hypothetical protein